MYLMCWKCFFCYGFFMSIVFEVCLVWLDVDGIVLLLFLIWWICMDKIWFLMIGGFFGVGKMIMIVKFVRILIECGECVGIVIND